MADKLQLENAGDEATIMIVAVKEVATKYGNKIVFAGMDEDGHAVETPLISDTTADKQLERLGLDRTSCVGETIRFSRASNPSGKPYWNLDVGTAKRPPSKRMAPPTTEVDFRGTTEVVGKSAPSSGGIAPLADRRAQLATDYCNLIKFVKKNSELADDSAVQAAAATIWISWRDHSVQAKPIAPAPVEQAPAIPTTPPPSGKRMAPPDQKPVTIPDTLPEAFHDDDLPFD